jgi:hypothetical protein
MVRQRTLTPFIEVRILAGHPRRVGKRLIWKDIFKHVVIGPHVGTNTIVRLTCRLGRYAANRRLRSTPPTPPGRHFSKWGGGFYRLHNSRWHGHWEDRAKDGFRRAAGVVMREGLQAIQQPIICKKIDNCPTHSRVNSDSHKDKAYTITPGPFRIYNRRSVG